MYVAMPYFVFMEAMVSCLIHGENISHVWRKNVFAGAYECRRQGNAWAVEYADVAAWKSARGHRVALPLSLGEACGSRRADDPGRMEWRIHQPG